MDWINNTQFLLINGKDNSYEFLEVYRKAYDCWHSVWIDAFKNELNIKNNVYSDQFTRQDEIGALFYEDQCVGLVFFNYMDLSLPAHRNDSYFSVWPKKAIDGLTKFGHDIIVCSNFTVNFDFRKPIDGIKWKDILMGLLVERFKFTESSAMTGTMRIIKGMHECTYRVGATSLNKDVCFSSEEDKVDLVAFYKDSVFPPTKEVEAIFNNSKMFQNQINQQAY